MDTLRMAGQGGPTTERYRFDDIVVDAAAHTLSRSGSAQTVEPKAFAVLLILLRRAGELVARDELLDLVWGHRHVTPGVLTRVIAQLRAALGDDSQHPRYIQTQHALGYRFIGELAPVAESAATPAEPQPASDDASKVEPPTAEPAGPRLPVQGATIPLPADEAANELIPGKRVARPRSRAWHWIAATVAVCVFALVSWWLPPRGTLPGAAEPSIAVLPFTTLSDRSDDRYFAEGLATELHSALAGVRGA